jgi:SPP1 family predicted phage head-tail adaptor
MTYDKPVDLQKQNEDTEKWETVMHFHARVNKTGGNQTFAADADQFHARLNFDFRYCEALEEVRYQPQLYRLLYRGHQFQITDYDDYLEQHRTVRIVGLLYE